MRTETHRVKCFIVVLGRGVRARDNKLKQEPVARRIGETRNQGHQRGRRVVHAARFFGPDNGDAHRLAPCPPWRNTGALFAFFSSHYVPLTVYALFAGRVGADRPLQEL